VRQSPALDEAKGESAVVVRARALRRVVEDGLAERRRLGELDVAAHRGVEHGRTGPRHVDAAELLELRLDLADHRARMARRAVMHAEEDAADADGWVQALRDQVHRLQQLLQPAQGQVVRLHRNEHLVGDGQRVHAQHAEARRAVEEDHVVVAPGLAQLVAEHGLHALELRQLALDERQLRDGGDEVEARARALHAVLHAALGVEQQVAHGALLGRALHPEVEREV
jgi:hypothetical protein